MIEIIQPGLQASLQDYGRFGLRHLGIPWSGALVAPWMRIANALVGNPSDAVVIECFEGGLVLQVGGQAERLAITGDAEVTADDGKSVTPLATWRSHTLAPGTTLRLRSSGSVRLAVIAIQGLDIPLHHHSRSTYAKAALGGLNGCTLQPGDCLTAACDLPAADLQCSALALPGTLLRAVPGPQADAFTDDVLQRFFSSSWTLTTDSDRMGARLDGPILTHRDASRRDIVSDATVPGSVQVPGNGLPIVLLADAHTAGGYPKIATVISSDLPLLALRRPGTDFHFSAVSADEGIDIARQGEAAIQDHLTSFHPVNEARLDINCLMTCNLIDGVTDGQ
jgi:allophanate hydrolase